jgi:DNA-directed RNA polymerase specialized sigma24 family protein
VSLENVELVRRYYDAWNGGDVAADRARLDERQMEVVVLRVTEGLEERAIAARLGISESEVASILDRVFESFRDLPSSEPVP